MAIYKVPQDVEAEDKLIGPFSFRQFVFILIMVGLLYLTYVFFNASPFMAIIPLPGAIFFGVLGLWPRKDQPVEVYLAALIHFWTQPRKKIWSQEGHIERVIITAPKKVEHQYTDGLQTHEVRSRLHNLASTLDSRGWAAKNIASPALAPAPAAFPAQQPLQQQANDRLVMPQVAAPQLGSTVITTAEEDVLDMANNPVAQNFQHLVDESENQRREDLMEQIHATSYDPDPEPTSASYNPYPSMHQNVVAPASQTPAPAPQQNYTQPEPDNPSPEPTSGAILNLAQNSDLNVSTIARQAEEALNSGDTIELH